MSSVTQICNLALSHLGVSKQISNFDSERSAEANACREFYETARDEVLQAFAWPFASKIKTLALIEEDPNDEWGYSYQYPTDCLRASRILSGSRNDTKDSEIKFRVMGDNDSRTIFTDKEDADLEYTVRITNTARFDAEFVMCLSFLLAAYIAPRIAGGDPFNKGQRALQMYAMKIPSVQARNENENKKDREPESEFINARN